MQEIIPRRHVQAGPPAPPRPPGLSQVTVQQGKYRKRSMNDTLNRLRFFWTRIWGKTCVWKRS
ncbi:MAG: hypothetical protein VB143_06850 [Burkholderia sp.]